MNTYVSMTAYAILQIALLTGCSRPDAGSKANGAAAAEYPVRSVHQGRTSDPYLVGGRCEGCEAVLEFGDRYLNAVDTLPGFNESEQRIRITGTIFQSDGITPAGNVVLYIYHTDRRGIYAHSDTSSGWARRHGDYRGWIMTGDDGKYTYYTFRPGAYPSWNAPAHIHPVILEPNGKYYWLEDYYFAGDPLLTDRQRQPAAPRGGTSGVLELDSTAAVPTATRDLILGANIPDDN